ncbi:enoyl-CoA hydratase/isomerase family protein [Microbacterium sp. A93]|uniref:enoyl-CoA hydratase/isomerase family protein n=1 Tax=Microbacterium sp. A93 TaxID=3450716 RepID=UPI003F42BFD0
MPQPVTLTVSEHIGHIQLNRPEAANTITLPLASALVEAVARVSADPDVHAVLLSGAGTRFCGGGDISSFTSASAPGPYLTELAATADTAVQTLESLKKPVVAAVQGAVAGGGLGIMLAADVIIAAEGTKFVYAYPSIGLTADCGASASLPRAMGLHRALAFALLGRPLDAAEAQSQGLVTEIAADPLARAHDVAAGWAAGAPEALGEARVLLRQSTTGTREEIGAREASMMGERVVTAEAQALMAAFLNR